MTELTANHVQIQHTSRFGRGGEIVKVERVTFYIGDQGPFSQDFAEAPDNTVAIRQFIDGKVAYVRGLVGNYGT